MNAEIQNEECARYLMYWCNRIYSCASVNHRIMGRNSNMSPSASAMAAATHIDLSAFGFERAHSLHAAQQYEQYSAQVVGDAAAEAASLSRRWRCSSDEDEVATKWSRSDDETGPPSRLATSRAGDTEPLDGSMRTVCG